MEEKILKIFFLKMMTMNEIMIYKDYKDYKKRIGDKNLKAGKLETRPDTRLPQSRAGGQGPYLSICTGAARPKTAKT